MFFSILAIMHRLDRPIVVDIIVIKTHLFENRCDMS